MPAISPTPSSSPSTLRPDLASFEEYNLEAERNGFVATQVLPVVDVRLQADDPGKLPVEALLFNGDTARASGSGYNRGSWNFEEFSYSTKENGWEEPIDEREKNRYAHIMQAEQVARNRAYSIVLRNQEQRVADAVFNTSTWTGAALTTAVSTEWSTKATATPIADVEAAVTKVYEGSGLWPNALIINRQVFRNLRNVDEIIDRVNSAGAGDRTTISDINTQMLAEVFDLEYIIVAGNSKNTAAEGQAASISQIWDDEYAMVARVATSADMREPCIGRTFHWSEDGSSIGGTIETYDEVQTRSEIVRVRHDTHEVIMYAAAGHLLSNITA